jgi:CHAD domain-containing protein
VARAREVGFDCEESFARAAARTIEVRAAEVFEHSPGVLAIDDPERVHDMRVATRRLRAAMEVFEPCFPRKRFRKTLREVKALADALGARRDPDVQIEFLERIVTEADPDPDDREAIARLIAGLREEQVRANEALAPLVGEERLAKLRRRLSKLVKKATA